MISEMFIQQTFVLCQALSFAVGTQKEKAEFASSRGSVCGKHMRR